MASSPQRNRYRTSLAMLLIAVRDEIDAALAEHDAEMHMGCACACEICDRRRALVAQIDLAIR